MIPPGLLILPLTSDVSITSENFYFNAATGDLRLDIPGVCKLVATGVKQLELYKPGLQDSRFLSNGFANTKGFPFRSKRA